MPATSTSPCIPEYIDGERAAFVFSTSHRRNFGKAFLAHIGKKPDGGLNYFPLCGWLARTPTPGHRSAPDGMKVCPRCLAKLAKLA